MSNNTLSYLTLHYRLLDRQPRAIPNLPIGQQVAATIFEAWVGAAFIEYAERRELHRLFDWASSIFNLNAWPQARASFFAHQGKDVPGKSLAFIRILQIIVEKQKHS